ncbi:ankyrin repeat-containing domain protein [Xylariomycetidae sp. FL0641]|nr:ankyrin repeat-containing domain protein [Xylariomycetidae sp. FL0641]
MGADINQRLYTRLTRTLLTEACHRGDFRTAVRLVNLGADARVQRNKKAVFHFALSLNRGGMPNPSNMWVVPDEGSRAELVRLLLQQGLDANAQGHAGLMPLHDAARSGLVGTVKVLLDAGASIDAETESGETALVFACSMPHGHGASRLPLTQLLLARGAVGAVGKALKAAIEASEASSRYSIVLLLLEHFASSKEVAESVPELVASCIQQGAGALLDLLLEYWPDAQVLPDCIGSCYHGLVENPCVRCLGFLLKQDSLVGDHNLIHDASTLKTLLEAARRDKNNGTKNNRRAEMAVYLLARGVPYRYSGQSTTALHQAGALGFNEVIRSLLDRGADPNAHDEERLTVLHHAIIQTTGKETLDTLLAECPSRKSFAAAGPPTTEDVDEEAWALRHRQVGSSATEHIEMLLVAGAKVDTLVLELIIVGFPTKLAQFKVLLWAAQRQRSFTENHWEHLVRLCCSYGRLKCLRILWGINLTATLEAWTCCRAEALSELLDRFTRMLPFSDYPAFIPEKRDKLLHEAFDMLKYLVLGWHDTGNALDFFEYPAQLMGSADPLEYSLLNAFRPYLLEETPPFLDVCPDRLRYLTVLHQRLYMPHSSSGVVMFRQDQEIPRIRNFDRESDCYTLAKPWGLREPVP